MYQLLYGAVTLLLNLVLFYYTFSITRMPKSFFEYEKGDNTYLLLQIHGFFLVLMSFNAFSGLIIFGIYLIDSMRKERKDRNTPARNAYYAAGGFVLYLLGALVLKGTWSYIP